MKNYNVILIIVSEIENDLIKYWLSDSMRFDCFRMWRLLVKTALLNLLFKIVLSVKGCPCILIEGRVGNGLNI